MNTSKWEDYEIILEKIRINSSNLSEYHRRRYYYFKDFSKWFRIPIIILSSLSGLFSLSLRPFIEQLYISLIIAFISLLTTIISSIELYLNIDQNQKMEFEQSKQYYILSIDIFKLLSLSRINRIEEPRDYLNQKYNEYIKLIESSNLLKRKLKIDLLTEIPEDYLDINSNKTLSNPSTPRPSTDSLDTNEEIELYNIDFKRIDEDIEEKIENETIFNL